MGLVKDSDENTTYIQIAYLRKRLKSLPFVYRNVYDFIIDNAPDDAVVIVKQK